MMTGCRRNVAVCNNSKEKTDRKGLNISYHRFSIDEHLKKYGCKGAEETESGIQIIAGCVLNTLRQTILKET